MIKKIVLLCLFILFINSLYAKPYGLRRSKKTVEFDGTVEVNYSVFNHEPFTQFIFIPELTFGKINFGFGFIFPVEFNYDNKFRLVEYNSIQAIIGKIYYIQYGFPEEQAFAFKISKLEDYTLGHGLILHRYNNNLFYPEIRKLGLRASLKISGIDFQVILGDVYTQSVLGGRLAFNFGKALKSNSKILNSFEIGATVVSDINPKRRNIIEANSPTDHTIVLKSESSSAVLEYGFDFSLGLIHSDYFNFNLYAEFAKITIAGEGFGYGFFGTVLPKSLALNYKFQFRHFFNSFSPSYFNTLYDVYRSSKVDSIKNYKAKLGWYLEVSRFFFQKRMAIIIAYDEIFNGEYNPHLFFKFYVHEVLKRFNFTLRFDRFNLVWSDIAYIESPDCFLWLEILYGVTKNIEIGFSYRKGFTIEESASVESTGKLVDISLYAKLLF